MFFKKKLSGCGQKSRQLNYFIEELAVSVRLSKVFLCTCHHHLTSRSTMCHCIKGVPREGGNGSTVPRAPNNWWAPKSPSNVPSTFFNTANLLQNDLRFELGGAKFVSCPGSGAI